MSTAATRRTRRAFPVVIGLAAALALAACGDPVEEADPETPASSGGGPVETDPIKIGAVLDITGAGASLGVPERQALEMLADALNEEGGIDGREVELLIEDNQSTEDGAATAASKLIDQEEVDILLGASRTGPSLAMRPLAEAAEIPMISLAANAAIVDGSQWVFKSAQNDRVVIENIIEYAAAQGWTTIGLARDASGFGEGIEEMLNEIGAEQGVTVVATESFAPDATDFTAQMVNLRDAAADAYLIWGIPPAAGLAQEAYRQLEIDAPVMQSHGIGNQVFLDTAGASADGLIAPLGRLVVADQLPEDDPQAEVIQEFVAQYQETYGENPSTFAGHAYDAFQLAVDALTEVGTDPAAIRDHLEQVEGFVGISGVFTMSPEDHSGLSKEALVLVTVEDGAFTLLDEG
jgi:branched-chain amino acid transport system substrate-binding protein